jgi:hypothetical protein
VHRQCTAIDCKIAVSNQGLETQMPGQQRFGNGPMGGRSSRGGRGGWRGEHQYTLISLGETYSWSIAAPSAEGRTKGGGGGLAATRG